MPSLKSAEIRTVFSRWLVFSACSLLLAIIVGFATMLSYERVPNALLAVMTESGLIAVVFLIVAIFGSISSLALNTLTRGRSFRAAALFVTQIALGLLFHQLWVSSWFQKLTLGTFLDFDEIHFFFKNTAALLQHFVSMFPERLLIAELGVILFAVAPVISSRLLAHRREARTAAAVFLIAAICGSAYIKPLTQAGPLDALWISHRARSALATNVVERPIEVENRPILLWSDYLAKVGAFKKWNVIYILAESLRPDQLKVFGGNRVVMPHLEMLASESTLFENAYAQSSHSDYADPCPFSSQYPLREVSHHYYPKDPPYPRVMVHDVLKKLGYRTSVFSSQNEDWGQMKNFLDTGSIDVFLHAGNYDGQTILNPEDTGFARWVAKNGLRSGKIDDKDTATEAIRWMKENSKSPFFTYINFQSSHVPYALPASFKRPFGSANRDFPLIFGKFPIEKKTAVLNLYADSLNYMDIQIGRILDFLKQAHLYDSTLIVVVGDNGTAFYEHGRADHAADLYDEEVRTAALIKIPGAKPARISYPFQHIDITPTVFGAMGLPIHPAFQGLNVLSPFRPRKHTLYFVAQSPIVEQYAIQHEGYKLIYTPRFDAYQLYSLVNDPGETVNLADKDVTRRKDLEARLRQWVFEQLQYYSSERQKHEYAPYFKD